MGAGMLMLLDIISLIYLFIAMFKIHKLITYNFATWKPNKCFIAIQIFVFSTPVLVNIWVVT